MVLANPELACKLVLKDKLPKFSGQVLIFFAHVNIAHYPHTSTLGMYRTTGRVGAVTASVNSLSSLAYIASKISSAMGSKNTNSIECNSVSNKLRHDINLWMIQLSF